MEETIVLVPDQSEISLANCRKIIGSPLMAVGLFYMRRLVHALGIAAIITFLIAFKELSWQFITLQQHLTIPDSKAYYTLPKSIWVRRHLYIESYGDSMNIFNQVDEEIRGGSCPIQIPSNIDDEFYSQWRDPFIHPIEPCHRPAAGASRIVGGRQLQPIARKCPGTLLYQTSNSLNLSSSKPLVSHFL